MSTAPRHQLPTLIFLNLLLDLEDKSFLRARMNIPMLISSIKTATRILDRLKMRLMRRSWDPQIKNNPLKKFSFY